MKAAAQSIGRLRLPRLGIGPQIIVLLLVLGLVGAMAIQPTRQLLAQRRRIAGMAGDLSQIQAMNNKLEARIERLQDPDFIEQRAREQAGLVRKGETTFVVMPPSRKAQRRKARARAARHEPPPPPAPEPGFVEGFLDFVGLN
jgi:cell division protein FtsB